MVVSCSTPTTISAWRSIRCLVGFWLLYTRKSGKVSGADQRPDSSPVPTAGTGLRVRVGPSNLLPTDIRES
jgi:hypothetical protein